ncbi:protein SFI1 homolog [Cololabis saira]|uniref:protein SFI1 homolog n=1 Tax=Cololabis saira TaxID=129043 RepID=UPI002AD43FED|nr:protein SFI1 homolog [Cololabis saira]
MQNNFARKSNLTKPHPVRSGETKQVRKVPTRKIPYRVGYTWNKGGRLKELRIRHLARKFLKIWMRHTFGQILANEASSYCNNRILRRTFQGWKDEWWTTRREWILTLRAECHYRYYLYIWAFGSWRQFISLKKEKKTKMENAQSLAGRRLMHLVWNRWKSFVEIRRIQNRMVETVLEQKRISTMHSVWSLWRTNLQQQQDVYILENQALNQRTLSLQRKAWFRGKAMHKAACYQKEKESKSTHHFILKLKRRTLHQWICYASCRKAKKKSKALAQRSCYLYLVRKYWSEWCNAVEHKQSEETCLQAASHLDIHSTQHRALMHLRAYVNLYKEETERNHLASQHFPHCLQRAGLDGLSCNDEWNRADGLNNNMAVQHCQQTMIRKYWKLWQDQLEETENESSQPLTEMALKSYRSFLLRSFFHHWREKLGEHKHMQELNHHADVWFKGRKLPLCFNSWVEFTVQRRLYDERKHKAEVYNRRRQWTWVFYTWREFSEKRKQEMLSERMAILHEEQCHVLKAWTRWKQRTQQQIEEAEKWEASHHLYVHRLLQKTMMQWKDNSTEIRDRRNRELQACHHSDLRCMRLAFEKWKKFVQRRREKKSRLTEVQRYHEVKILKNSFVDWKKHHLQMTQDYDHAKDFFRRETLRKVLTVWKEKAALRAKVQIAEQQAQNHFQHFLQLKVFLGWRKTTTRAVSQRQQQGEALRRARSIHQARLLQCFRQWRSRTRKARRERMEKASQHHYSGSETVKTCSKYLYQHQKNKVMKRQGILLLKLKMYQKYFEQWKVKLQHRQRETKQTEQALWHWSLTLQAKVLFRWRMCVTEQHSKREQAARAAQVYRDQLLREGVTSILTYAAHMSDLTTNLMEFSQPQRSQSLQKVVKRCAMRWKQRTLGRPRQGQKVLVQAPKRSVTFCLTPPLSNSFSSSDSVEQEAEDGALSKHTQKKSGVTSTEATLNPLEFSYPSHTEHPAVPSCLHFSKQPVFPSEPHVSTVDSSFKAQGQDLLPPSAFTIPRSQNKLGRSSNPDPGEAPFMGFQQSSMSFRQHPSAHPETNLKTSSMRAEDPHAEDASTDPTLTRELLSIHLDMKSFQQSRKQLRMWRKLREVYQSWLQMSRDEDEQMEKKTICEDLKKLEERIQRLSTELEKRKPTMQLHVDRIQHLQSVLHTSGIYSLVKT